ncbi:MAG: efflux RND transporter permease subunit [Spirochaetes bacterium]|nr:efflux RND transporter permease subunit [Spirochaetota bacterium]
MKLTDISVNRYITAIMVFIAVGVLGYVSFSKMPLDLYPDIEFPVAVIILQYPDVGPKEVESTVTRPVEETLASVNNLDTIISTSKEGMAVITMKFVWGTDMGLAVSDIRERIDIIKGYLPEDVETPIVLKFDMSMIPVMMLSVSGPRDSMWMREYADDNLKNQFERIDGVASAMVLGGDKREVHVELLKSRMDAYGLTVDTLSKIVALENLNIAGGDIRSPQRKFTLRARGDFMSLSDIRNVVVSVKGGAPVYLYDIARVYEGPAEKTEVMRLNGRSGVLLRVSKQSDKNTVLVCRNINKRLDEIRKTLPPGIVIEPIFDQSEYIEQAISAVTDSAWQGSLLAILVVFVFLRNIRSALILGLSIPLSIIATFIAMYANGISLNMMSMGGLALGVGLLIDNSIVVLDNIFRYRERGARPTEAAKLGAEEMWLAIAASTLTNIVVFIPFLFTEGLAKQLFTQMALTITFSMLFSLIIALTLIPMMTARFVPRAEKVYRGRLSFLNRMFSWSKERLDELDAVYSRVIEWALGHRKQVILYTGLAIVAGIMAIFLAGAEYMPEQDNGQLEFQVKLPVGTNLETTEKTLIEIERKVGNIVRKQEYRVMSVRAGYGEGIGGAFGDTTDNKASMEFMLVPASQRKRSLSDIRAALRDGLAGFPGVTFNFSPQSAGSRMFGMGEGTTVIINVYGYDFDESKRFTAEIFNAIKDIPGLKDIDISREEGLPEKVMEINREKASRAGLSSVTIATAIKDNVAGKVATVYRHKGKEYDVRLRLRPEDRKNLDNIKQIQVGTLLGTTVPVGNYLDIRDATGPTTIERERQERVTYVTCRPEGRPLDAVVRDIQEKLDKIVKPTNFYVEITGSFKDMQETFRDLLLAIILAVILIYIIMASQFESLLSPFIVMFSIPTIIFGVGVFLFLTGTTFSVVAFMGMIMLTGIVVNNAIVLVDYTNILRARGTPLREAIIQAGRNRLRPILMTTFTTIFGLVPMAIGIGEGAEMSAPLARSVLGGMFSSFIFTLIFIPVMYSLFESLKERWRSRGKGRI